MESITIYPKNEKQKSLIKSLLEELKVRFEIGDEIDFVSAEAKRIRLRYPKILVTPMLYNVDDNNISIVRE